MQRDVLMRARQVSKYDLPFNVWRSACLANVFCSREKIPVDPRSFIYHSNNDIEILSLGRETDALPIKIVAIAKKCAGTVILSTDIIDAARYFPVTSSIK